TELSDRTPPSRALPDCGLFGTGVVEPGVFEPAAVEPGVEASDSDAAVSGPDGDGLRGSASGSIQRPSTSCTT
ncbi:MAG: hypothetical protein ACRDVE_07755, partial [Actinocrinis sp.]